MVMPSPVRSDDIRDPTRIRSSSGLSRNGCVILYARDVPIGRDEAPDAIDLASADPDPETLVSREEERRETAARLSRALGTLDGRERAIVQARCVRETPATLGVLGSVLGNSPERVRQIESRARAKMQAAVLASVA